MQINADLKHDKGSRLVPVCLKPICFSDFPDNQMWKRKIIETISHPERHEAIS